MNTPFYVYICHCADGTLYTGITNEPERRIMEHNGQGALPNIGAKYTRARRPVHMVFLQKCKNRSEASREEYRIKKLTKSQKEALLGSSRNEYVKNKI